MCCARVLCVQRGLSLTPRPDLGTGSWGCGASVGLLDSATHAKGVWVFSGDFLFSGFSLGQLELLTAAFVSLLLDLDQMQKQRCVRCRTLIVVSDPQGSLSEERVGVCQFYCVVPGTLLGVTKGASK